MLVTVDSMRRMEKKAMEAGLSGRLLMENAASAAHRAILSYHPTGVVVLCGKGNNAGDGFAVARRLFIRGVPTEIVLLSDPALLPPDAAANYTLAATLGVPITPWEAFSQNPGGRLLVDALFGIGLHGEVSGTYAAAIRWMNDAPSPVVSLDIPSGIDGDTGKVHGLAVHADCTVTFGLAKLGLYSPLSADYVGKVIVEDISIPRPKQNPHFLLKKEDLSLPAMSRAAHKGLWGRAAIFGGSDGMAGSVYMATRAAEMSGAGLVTAIVPESLMPAMMARLTGAMCRTDLPSSDALLVGCGLGRTADARHRLLTALKAPVKTLVIDADGLYHLTPDDFSQTNAAVIITPHIGEMARLCGLSAQAVTENRVSLAMDFATRYQITVVLKGAYTVVALPDGTTYTNITGNEGMAKGGSGDILAGLICGLAASGAKMPARTGVYLHGLAGDMAAQKVAKRALHAEILLKFLPDAIKCMEDGFSVQNSIEANPYHGINYI
ncbi:MAG: NAD(P)H-hydrate dehydratase [Clostridia bacterium]|nr:NAD(P)H-hydrate dehydratase [Clostridia bacterium]